MQILIVEDEKRLAEALKQILLEQKYMADVVYDGNDGMDYGMSGIYDLIILDVMLPHRDGFEIANELRKNRIQTPILMLTAKDAVSDKVSGLNSGADDYMTKPFVGTQQRCGRLHDKALCARGAARARQGAHATQRRGHAR